MIPLFSTLLRLVVKSYHEKKQRQDPVAVRGNFPSNRLAFRVRGERSLSRQKGLHFNGLKTDSAILIDGYIWRAQTLGDCRATRFLGGLQWEYRVKGRTELRRAYESDLTSEQ